MAVGRYVWDDTKAWETVCDASACDWQQAFDTGAGHSITAVAANGAVTYAGWCGPCNPDTGAPFTRGVATNYGGSWHQPATPQLPNRYITSIAVDPTDAAHAYLSFGSYSRRWIPDAGVGHVSRPPTAAPHGPMSAATCRMTRLQGRHPWLQPGRRHRGRRLPQARDPHRRR